VEERTAAALLPEIGRIEDFGEIRVLVRDDGVGAVRHHGSGILGLADRIAALDGQLTIESPADGGARVAADIRVPVSSPDPVAKPGR
jgi:signal transduction histidine kinase